MTSKNNEIGYYSLIQYCPNEMVGEVANIGVLLFVPKTGFVDVRVTPTNQRIAHIFGGGIHKYDMLQRYKDGLAEWVRVEHRKFLSLETAKSFFAANSNTIVFSPIRGIVCPEGAEKTLGTLYAKFFPCETMPLPKAPRAPHFAPKRVFNTLRSKYGKDIDHKLAILPNLEVIGLARHIQPAFGFQNRHFHVVFPRYFTSERCEEQIGLGLLISSEMKTAKERIWKGAKPVILGRVQLSNYDLSCHIAETFKRYKIQFYADEQALVDYVGKEAKTLPDYAAEYAIAKMGTNLFR